MQTSFNIKFHNLNRVVQQKEAHRLRIGNNTLDYVGVYASFFHYQLLSNYYPLQQMFQMKDKKL